MGIGAGLPGPCWAQGAPLQKRSPNIPGPVIVNDVAPAQHVCCFGPTWCRLRTLPLVSPALHNVSECWDMIVIVSQTD